MDNSTDDAYYTVRANMPRLARIAWHHYYYHYISLQQPAAEEVKTDYISSDNISEVAIYEPIGPTATVSPNSSSFRAFEDYTFYNSYPNYLNRGKGDGEAVLRGYTCWDTYTAKLKSNQCKASCKYAYTSVCQQRQCPKPMVTRAVTLCIYLCAAEFE